MRHVFFDMDGVVIDSAATVAEAYRRAGVEPPEDILGQEGVDWISAQVPASSVSEVRGRKNREYLALLRQGHARFLPPLGVAQRLAEEGHEVGIMTAAPVGTIAVLRKRAHPWPFSVFFERVHTPQKMHILGDIGIDEGVYIDDRAMALEMLPPGWTFIRYEGQDELSLYEEVLRCNSA